MADERSPDQNLLGVNGFEKHSRAEITPVEWMSSLEKPDLRPGLYANIHTSWTFPNLSLCETTLTVAEI